MNNQIYRLCNDVFTWDVDSGILTVYCSSSSGDEAVIGAFNVPLFPDDEVVTAVAVFFNRGNHALRISIPLSMLKL